MLQKNMVNRSKGLGDVCEKNRYTLQFLLAMAELRKTRAKEEKVFQGANENELQSDSETSLDLEEDMQLESRWSDICD